MSCPSTQERVVRMASGRLPSSMPRVVRPEGPRQPLQAEAEPGQRSLGEATVSSLAEADTGLKLQ